MGICGFMGIRGFMWEFMYCLYKVCILLNPSLEARRTSKDGSRGENSVDFPRVPTMQNPYSLLCSRIMAIQIKLP